MSCPLVTFTHRRVQYCDVKICPNLYWTRALAEKLAVVNRLKLSSWLTLLYV